MERVVKSQRSLGFSTMTSSFREVKIIKVYISFEPEVKVICGAKRTVDGLKTKDLDWSDGLGRHHGETKMGSTLMVKIGLNRESPDDLS